MSESQSAESGPVEQDSSDSEHNESVQGSNGDKASGSQPDGPASVPFSPALSAQFRERIRPVLNSIDRLRSHGLQSELRLPTVAVVGDQSVGKSSVLEAISGVDLPRGTGIVTRCPLQLSMRSKPPGVWQGQISYQDSKGQRVEHTISSKSKVGQLVRKAQDAITDSATGISKEQIDLTIESSEVSDLTLIDLPGIARYSEKNANISDTTKKLIRHYISQEQVIILVVVPCHVDIETVEAIALAKEVDPRGVRTIGVMTCPDLTNPGSEEEVKATVCNMGSVRLSKGFVMVKCRSPQELKQNIGLAEVAQMEADFFAGHRHFSQLPKDLVGTKTLAEKLTDELFRAVAKGLEALEGNLKAKLKEYEEELKDLGDSLCDSDSDKRYYLMRKLQQFLSRVEGVTASGESDEDACVIGRTSELYNSCRSQCASFGQHLNSAIPDWITNYNKPVPTSVERAAVQLRGRELLTFSFVFPIVQRIVRKEFLPEVSERAFELLEIVHSSVAKALDAVAKACFGAFPELLMDVNVTVAKATNAKAAECRADLEKLFTHEGLLFMQDDRFAKRLERETAELHKAKADAHFVRACTGLSEERSRVRICGRRPRVRQRTSCVLPGAALPQERGNSAVLVAQR